MTEAPVSTLSPGGFNPFDPGFLENPFPFYRIGRQMMPVMEIPGRGLWAAFRYDDCVAILKDAASWASSPPGGTMPNGTEPSMLMADPPRHTRLRSLVSQAFTPRMVEQLEPRIRQVANELLDEGVVNRKTDIVESFTYPLPVIMIAEILGVPTEDRDRFKVWSDTIVATLGQGFSENPQAPPQAMMEEIGGYFSDLCDQRRANPKADLITGLVQAEEQGDKLSFSELMQMLVLLLVAGNETTTNLIGNALLEFIDHPDELQRLRENPALLPTAIEEVLRFSGPVQATVRRATRDMDLGGKTIPQDQQILVWLASGNRDHNVFPEPDRFDIARTPNRHLTFGMGVHFCLGAPLARLETKVAMEEFLKRYSGYERTTTGSLPRVPTFIMHGVTSMPISVTV